MAVNFPGSPTNGQVHTSGGISWIYDSALGAWKIVPNTITGSQGIQGIQGVSVQGSSGTSQGIQGIQGAQGANGIQGIQGTSIASLINATAVTSDTKLYPVLVYNPGSSQTAQTITSFAFNSTFSAFTIGTHTSSAALIYLNGGTPFSVRGMQITTANTNRWYIGTDIASEAGSNAGTNLIIQNSGDIGGTIGTVRPLTIYRSNGVVAIANLTSSNVTSSTSIYSPYYYLPAQGAGVERHIMWNFTLRNVYFYGQDNTQTVGLYDNVGGSRWLSANSGMFQVPTFTSLGRIYANEWTQFDNYSGLYSPINNAHFYPNDGTYGSWRSRGSRNGWAGIEFPNDSNSSSNSTTLMMNTDSYGFHYNGTGWRMYVSGGTLYVPGNLVAYWSDKRLKENIKPIGKEATDILSKLSAYRFNWNDKVSKFGIEVKPGKEEIGLLAQEVQEAIPDAVSINKSSNKVDSDGTQTESDYLTINWNKITPLLVQALNNTTRELNELKKLLRDKEII